MIRSLEPAQGTRAAEAPGPGAGSAVGFVGEIQAGLCERPGACLDPGGLNRKNFSKRKKREKIDAFSG